MSGAGPVFRASDVTFLPLAGPSPLEHDVLRDVTQEVLTLETGLPRFKEVEMFYVGMTGSGRGLSERVQDHFDGRKRGIELVYALPIAVGVREGTAGLLDSDTAEGQVMRAARESLPVHIKCANGTQALGGSGLCASLIRGQWLCSHGTAGGDQCTRRKLQILSAYQAAATYRPLPAHRTNPHEASK